ncbi:substrate-binding domain-containing protein, partial [Staphylococcus aureus]|nr:substrate-binding domain-containing protein [Staphylococcus aureus]
IVGNQHRSGNDALIQHLHGLLKTGHGTPVAFPFRYRLNEGIVPTAMLVANDQMALGAMRAITESGLRVGADISVVGYDDTEDSSCYIPPLTTIKQDFRLLGQTSVDRLLQLSQGQ